MADNIYFTTIFNRKIKKIMESIQIDSAFTVQEIIYNNPLWIVEDHQLAWRCFPLFNTETITSTNPDIKVIENKVVIIPKTIDMKEHINTTSNNSTGTGANEYISLYAYTFYNKQIVSLRNKVSVYCTVSDGYGNIIPNKEILVQTSTDGETWNTINTVKSDTTGICAYTFTQITSTIYVRFTDIEQENKSNTVELGTVSKYPSRITITGE